MLIEISVGEETRLFPTGDYHMICEMDTWNRSEVDRRLRLLRLRRRTAWNKTEWGWQAQVRFKGGGRKEE